MEAPSYEAPLPRLWQRGGMEASRPARACGFLSFWSTCAELVRVLTRVKWEEAAKGRGDIDGWLTACRVSFTPHVISYHHHAQLQMGKLRHRAPPLALGGIQQVKLSLLGLTGCSRDLSPNVTNPEGAERKRRGKGFLPSWGGPCAGGGGAGLVRAGAPRGRVREARAAGSASPGAGWLALAPLLASFIFACRGLNDLSCR